MQKLTVLFSLGLILQISKNISFYTDKLI